jgi:hypothetical protein
MQFWNVDDGDTSCVQMLLVLETAPASSYGAMHAQLAGPRGPSQCFGITRQE